MFDVTMRKVKHRITGAFALWLGKYLGPAPITLAALATGLVSAGFAAAGLAIPALILWLLNRFLDGLDGEVARVRGDACDYGGYIDMMSDVVVYAAIPLAVAFHRAEFAVAMALLLMMAAFYTNITSWSYLSALLEKRRAPDAGCTDVYETSIEMPHGLIEGTETIVVYALLLGIPALALETALIAAAAGLISTLQRVIWAHRALRH